MKNYYAFMLIVAGALLSGCATEKNGMVLDTVGPTFAQPAASSLTNGTLVIYSAFKRNADFNNPDPYRWEHSDFSLFAPDGKLLQRVHNISETALRDVVPVELPPGKYNVKARANGYGFVTIPVIIESRQTTTLHLEGGGFWPNESLFNQTNAVRLPDGQIIGWRAVPDS
jgi:hypothetical protein